MSSVIILTPDRLLLLVSFASQILESGPNAAPQGIRDEQGRADSLHEKEESEKEITNRPVGQHISLSLFVCPSFHHLLLDSLFLAFMVLLPPLLFSPFLLQAILILL